MECNQVDMYTLKCLKRSLISKMAHYRQVICILEFFFFCKIRHMVNEWTLQILYHTYVLQNARLRKTLDGSTGFFFYMYIYILFTLYEKSHIYTWRGIGCSLIHNHIYVFVFVK